jgi:hypothetical protein
MHTRISQSGILKAIGLPGLLACLLILTRPIYAQEPPLVEKIRDVSPDGGYHLSRSDHGG